MSYARVGVGVLIKKDNMILLGKRIHENGDSPWGFPGGQVEFFEPVMDAAQREVYEETGLNVKDLELVAYTDDLFREENQHFVTIVFVAGNFIGDLHLKEPTKFEKWDWFSWNNLPSPLAEPMLQLLKQNFDPFA